MKHKIRIEAAEVGIDSKVFLDDKDITDLLTGVTFHAGIDGPTTATLDCCCPVECEGDFAVTLRPDAILVECPKCRATTEIAR